MDRLPTIEGTVDQRIALRLISMPKRFHKITDWLVENRFRLPYMSAERVIKELKLRRNDLYEFSRLLGYDGFKELKEEIMADVVEKIDYFYSREDKANTYYRIYQHLNTEKGYQSAPKCYQCGDDRVFWHKRHWYFDTRSGTSEPEIKFCPFCGQKLNKTYPHTSIKSKRERKSAQS